MQPRIAALVPMRHESIRVPKKNYRLFSGKPLYHHIIESLLDCSLIDEVVIDTDSPFIMEDSAKHFPTIKLLDRPEHLRADTTPMNDVLINSINQITAEYYLQTHSTNPLLSSRTIETAINTFLSNCPIHDSLFSVTRVQNRIWDNLARPINHNPNILLRTQDLPPMFTENSCLYIFPKLTLESKHNRIGDRPFMFEIDNIESWDIDQEIDFQVAELLHKTTRDVK